MPETLIQNMEKIAVAIGAAVLVLVGLWSRLAGLMPAKKKDVQPLAETLQQIQAQHERLHERFDELKDDLHEVKIKQARIEGACAALRGMDRRKP